MITSTSPPSTYNIIIDMMVKWSEYDIYLPIGQICTIITICKKYICSNVSHLKRGVGHGVRFDHQLQVPTAVSRLRRAASRAGREAEQDVIVVVVIVIVFVAVTFAELNERDSEDP